MLFGTTKCLNNTNKKLHISYKGQKINNVSEYKYLGNIVDRYLNLNNNFDKVYKKASQRLKLLKRLRLYVTEDAAYKIYTRIIIPILTYRGPLKLNYTNTQLERFKSLEKRAKQIIGKSVPSILNCINKEALMIVKRTLENVTCQNLEGYFKLNNHEKTTRNNGYLVQLPKFKLKIGQESFCYSGAKLFNSLPLEIRKEESITEFEKNIKYFLKLN